MRPRCRSSRRPRSLDPRSRTTRPTTSAWPRFGLGRYDQALLVLSLLAAKPLDGALKELVPLRMAEAALALNMPDRAEGALVGADARKSWPSQARCGSRARAWRTPPSHRAHALDAYRRLYYDHPLTEEAAEAPAALSRLQAAGEVSVETDRALARAERLYAARRWTRRARRRSPPCKRGQWRRQSRRAAADRGMRLLPEQPARGARGAGPAVRWSARGARPATSTCWPPRRCDRAAFAPLARKLVGGASPARRGRSRRSTSWRRTSSRSTRTTRPTRCSASWCAPIPRARTPSARRGRWAGAPTGAATSRRRSTSSRPRPPTSRAPTTGRRGSTGPAGRASG